MGTLREALVRNGVFYYELNGEDLTIQDGFGSYMVAYDKNGNAKYRIRDAELNAGRAVVENYYGGGVVGYLTI